MEGNKIENVGELDLILQEMSKIMRSIDSPLNNSRGLPQKYLAYFLRNQRNFDPKSAGGDYSKLKMIVDHKLSMEKFPPIPVERLRYTYRKHRENPDLLYREINDFLKGIKDYKSIDECLYGSYLALSTNFNEKDSEELELMPCLLEIESPSKENAPAVFYHTRKNGEYIKYSGDISVKHGAAFICLESEGEFIYMVGLYMPSNGMADLEFLCVAFDSSNGFPRAYRKVLAPISPSDRQVGDDRLMVVDEQVEKISENIEKYLLLNDDHLLGSRFWSAINDFQKSTSLNDSYLSHLDGKTFSSYNLMSIDGNAVYKRRWKFELVKGKMSVRRFGSGEAKHYSGFARMIDENKGIIELGSTQDSHNRRFYYFEEKLSAPPESLKLLGLGISNNPKEIISFHEVLILEDDDYQEPAETINFKDIKLFDAGSAKLVTAFNELIGNHGPVMGLRNDSIPMSEIYCGEYKAYYISGDGTTDYDEFHISKAKSGYAGFHYRGRNQKRQYLTIFQQVTEKWSLVICRDVEQMSSKHAPKRYIQLCLNIDQNYELKSNEIQLISGTRTTVSKKAHDMPIAQATVLVKKGGDVSEEHVRRYLDLTLHHPLMIKPLYEISKLMDYGNFGRDLVSKFRKLLKPYLLAYDVYNGPFIDLLFGEIKRYIGASGIKKVGDYASLFHINYCEFLKSIEAEDSKIISLSYANPEYFWDTSKEFEIVNQEMRNFLRKGSKRKIERIFVFSGIDDPNEIDIDGLEIIAKHYDIFSGFDNKLDEGSGELYLLMKEGYQALKDEDVFRRNLEMFFGESSHKIIWDVKVNQFVINEIEVSQKEEYFEKKKHIFEEIKAKSDMVDSDRMLQLRQKLLKKKIQKYENESNKLKAQLDKLNA